MRCFRQAVLALLLSLLCAGPALAALPQADCMTRAAACPLCGHGGEPMHCAGDRQTNLHAAPQHGIMISSLKGSDPACVCRLQSVSAAADAQAPASFPQKAVAPAVSSQAIVWPPTQPLISPARFLESAAATTLRARAPSTLRV